MSKQGGLRWSAPILTNIVLMLPPEQTITHLRLFRVSKAFKAAVDDVISFQLHQSKSKINSLQTAVLEIEENKMLQISNEIPSLIERINMIPTMSELQDLSDQITVPSL